MIVISLAAEMLGNKGMPLFYAVCHKNGAMICPEIWWKQVVYEYRLTCYWNQYKSVYVYYLCESRDNKCPRESNNKRVSM